MEPIWGTRTETHVATVVGTARLARLTLRVVRCAFFCFSYRGTSLMRNSTPPQDFHRTRSLLTTCHTVDHDPFVKSRLASRS